MVTEYLHKYIFSNGYLPADFTNYLFYLSHLHHFKQNWSNKNLKQ